MRIHFVNIAKQRFELQIGFNPEKVKVGRACVLRQVTKFKFMFIPQQLHENQ